MKKLLIFSFLLSVFIQKLDAQTKTRRFKFGIQMSSLVVDRQSFEQNGQVSIEKSTFDKIEQMRFSGSAGLFSEFLMAPKLSFRVGANYLSSGWSWGEVEFTDQTGATSGKGRSDVFFNFLEIPLEIRVDLLKNYQINFGGIVNRLLEEHTTTSGSFEEKKFTRKNSFVANSPNFSVQKNQFAFRLGIGRSFHGKNGFVAEISPRFQYFLTPLIAQKTPINRRLWDAGIQFSVKI